MAPSSRELSPVPLARVTEGGSKGAVGAVEAVGAQHGEKGVQSRMPAPPLPPLRFAGEQLVFHRITQRLEAGFDDVVRYAHRRPDAAGVGGFNQDAHLRGGGGVWRQRHPVHPAAVGQK